PVARAARDRGLPLLQPADLRDPAFLAALRSWDAEIFAVVAFRILPEEVYGIPPHGAVNLHASLLPAYRGAAPIQWALWEGETVTGLTTFRIERTVDTGNILKQRRVEIWERDDAGSLAARMAREGAQLLVETLDGLERGDLSPQPQDHRLASPAPKITKEHGRLDWTRPARELVDQIRALSPEPAACTTLQGQALKIFRAEPVSESPGLAPGELLITDREMIAGTGSEPLRLAEIQLQGKKRMDTTSFLRGFRPRGRFTLES
ncbi:MAG: methionyl-tRNA formyltransferase, partial [Candidatus Zixiibacteriota bacterium]